MVSDDADETGHMDEGYGGQTVDSNVDSEDLFAQVTCIYNYIFLLSSHISKGHQDLFRGIFLAGLFFKYQRILWLKKEFLLALLLL